MGLEHIIDEVRQDGDRRAEAILAKAREEAAAILAEAQSRVDEYRVRRETMASREIEQLKVQVASSAEFEARKVVLNREARLRKQLRQTLLDGFASLPANVRKKHMQALAKRASAVVESGRMWASKQDAELVGTLAGYESAGTMDIRGGLVVESKDGTVRLDLSYETLLDDLWRDILKAEAGLFA